MINAQAMGKVMFTLKEIVPTSVIAQNKENRLDSSKKCKCVKRIPADFCTMKISKENIDEHSS